MGDYQTMDDLDKNFDMAAVHAASEGRVSQRKGPKVSRTQAREEEKAQEKKEKKKKKKIKDGVEDETKKGGIRWLPLFFVFMFTAPAVLPVVFSGIDMLGETSAGVAIHKWGMEVGLVSSYETKLKSFYDYNLPKKAKDLPRLLRKWKGREDKLYKMVTGKFEQHQRIKAIRKQANKQEYLEKKKRAEHRKAEEKARKGGGWFGGGGSTKKKKAKKKTKVAAGWDDEPTESEIEPDNELGEESDDADDIMADLLKSEGK